MHGAFYKTAPDGKMSAACMMKYLEQLSLMGFFSFRENKNGWVDADLQAAKLFRGYAHAGGESFTFTEYLACQEAIIFKTPLLPRIVFSIIDVNRDRLIRAADLVCMVQGADEVEDDEYLPIISDQVMGLWLFFAGTADVLTIDAERFEKCVNESEGMLDKILALL